MRVCRLWAAFPPRLPESDCPLVSLHRPRHLRALGDLNQDVTFIPVPPCVRARVSAQDVLQIHDRHHRCLGHSLYRAPLGPVPPSLPLLGDFGKGPSLLGLRLSVRHPSAVSGALGSSLAPQTGNHWLTLLDRNPLAIMRLFVGQAISTALLDFTVFAIPIPLCFKPDTPRKTRLCLLGLFVLGSLYLRSCSAPPRCPH